MSSEYPLDISSDGIIAQNATRGGLTATDLFDALANERRQFVIRAVADGEQTLGGIAEDLARAENDLDAHVRVDSDLRKRAYVALYQNHLGALDQLDIVSWDQQSGAVTPGPNHEQALGTLWFAIDEDASLPQHVRDVVGGER